MNTILTLLIAFFVISLALALLGIGWILTGKSRIVRGACGMDPKKLRDQKCGTDEIHCQLCQPEQKENKEKNADGED